MITVKFLQFVINLLIMILTPLCWYYEGIQKTVFMLYILLPVYYLAILLTFFADTSNFIVVDPNDNIFSYFLRFFPFYMLLFVFCYKYELLFELLFLFGSLIYTRNSTIKDEYRRLISLIIFVYFVRNILVSDLYLILFFLWWYHIIFVNSFKILSFFNKQYLITILYFYTRYFVLRKNGIVGILFNILIFSTPFFFYYFFDQRLLGIILINILLSILLIARVFYVKTITSPAFAFSFLKGLALKYCDLYFTAITTLIQFEIEPVIADLTWEGNWIVYIEYEKHREKIRDMILTDLYRMELEPKNYQNISGLEEDLKRYFELAELPFFKDNFIKNKSMLLTNYESIENRQVVDSEGFKGLKVGLLVNNEIEARIKNPIYFVGFFSESRFFLHK